MSQQDGVSSSLASIEAATRNHRTVFTTTTHTDSHPSTSSIPASSGSSKAPPLSNSSRSGTTSGRVHIPKLSAATTELLARVAGSIRGAQQQGLPKNDRTPTIWGPFSINSNWNSRNTNSQRAGTMRVSSTFIELPTAPFIYSDRVETPVLSPSPIPTPLQPTYGINGFLGKPPGLPNIAPKPAVACSTSTSIPVGPKAAAEIQPPSEPQPPPLSIPSAVTTISRALDTPSVAGVPAAKPVKPTSTPHQRRGVGNREKGSKKRKRGQGSDNEDIIRAGDSSSDESDATPAATQTKSGRQVNRPSLYVPSPLSPALPKENSTPIGIPDKFQEATKRKRVFRKGKNTNITCVHCQRSHSPSSNAIVLCDGCNQAWHQHCHDPPISNDVITVKEKEWLCRECKPSKIVILYPKFVRRNPNPTSEVPVHAPLALPKIDVGGERFPADDRRRYLSRLSHATLVELLFTISGQHPTVPMFPENMRALLSSRFSYSNCDVAATTATPTQQPSGSTYGSVPSNAIDFAPTANTQIEHDSELSDSESEYEFPEHRLYPRSEHGVRLSTNAEDLDILQEDPACPTFSYAFHGPVQFSTNGGVSV
ncbi:hypothetical protein BDW59DRAFT_84140 [Aspergillus cavernicola]|uniref:PHD-type domain-containing protein n=1 Tax=Aspergillus cavernicola TaxID=176166 RepID=A0ABR4IA60_9EURO